MVTELIKISKKQARLSTIRGSYQQFGVFPLILLAWTGKAYKFVEQIKLMFNQQFI